MMHRELGTVVLLGALGMVVLAPAGTASAATTCQITNKSIKRSTYSDLQTAVASASPGDVLVVRGTCVGSTTIGITVTLTGEGGAPTLDGQQGGTVLTIGADQFVTINSLTITGGRPGGILNQGTVVLRSSSVTGNTNAPGDLGCGIRNDSNGSVILHKSSVAGNTGCGIRNDGSGGVLLYGSSITGNTGLGGAPAGIWNAWNGTIVLSNSTVSNNTNACPSCQGSRGGGIGNQVGTIILRDSSISGNTTTTLVGNDYGGGISNMGGTVVLYGRSSIAGNWAGKGGSGIENDFGGTITLNDRSSITDNFGAFLGGGIDNERGTVILNDRSSISGNTAARGGGIFNAGSVTMQGNSAIDNNTAQEDGGGIYNEGMLNGAIAGVNVYNNTPDDIAP